MQPTVANDIVLVGTGGPGVYTGPGSFIALNKYTGSIIRETRLGTEYFQSGIAVVQDYVMFGTGYASEQGMANGTFSVWRLRKRTDFTDRS